MNLFERCKNIGLVTDIQVVFEKEQDSLNVSNTLNKKHSNIKFTIEKQVTLCQEYLDIDFID